MSSLARSKPFAVMVAGGSIATAGYMYLAGTQTKKVTQPTSIYKTEDEGAGLTSGQTDARMDSHDVRAAVQGNRKP